MEAQSNSRRGVRLEGREEDRVILPSGLGTKRIDPGGGRTSRQAFRAGLV